MFVQCDFFALKKKRSKSYVEVVSFKHELQQLMQYHAKAERGRCVSSI
jgi:hypothetical protein